MNTSTGENSRENSRYSNLLTAIEMILHITWQMQSRFNIGIRRASGI